MTRTVLRSEISEAVQNRLAASETINFEFKRLCISGPYEVRVFVIVNLKTLRQTRSDRQRPDEISHDAKFGTKTLDRAALFAKSSGYERLRAKYFSLSKF